MKKHLPFTVHEALVWAHKKKGVHMGERCASALSAKNMGHSISKSMLKRFTTKINFDEDEPITVIVDSRYILFK